MGDLSSFSQSEAELLVSLPYKVGVWISAAEDAEGEDDDKHELLTLAGCLKAVVTANADTPFIKAVAQQTLALRSEWPRWEGQSFNVTEDAEKAMSLLKARVPAQQSKNYRRMLMEIATAVAQAYGEFGEFEDEGEGFFTKIMDKFKALSQEDSDHPMNVSPGEESALAELAQALKKGTE